MLEGREDHMRAGDLGLVFFLVQCPIQLLRDLRNFPGKLGVTMLLDIAPAARVFHTDGAEHDEQRCGGDPFLSVREPGDLFDQGAVGEDAEHPGLFVPAGRGEPRGFEQILYDFFGNRFVLEAADAYTLFQQRSDHCCAPRNILEIKDMAYSTCASAVSSKTSTPEIAIKLEYMRKRRIPCSALLLEAIIGPTRRKALYQNPSAIIPTINKCLTSIMTDQKLPKSPTPK